MYVIYVCDLCMLPADCTTPRRSTRSPAPCVRSFWTCNSGACPTRKWWIYMCLYKTTYIYIYTCYIITLWNILEYHIILCVIIYIIALYYTYIYMYYTSVIIHTYIDIYIYIYHSILQRPLRDWTSWTQPAHLRAIKRGVKVHCSSSARKGWVSHQEQIPIKFRYKWQDEEIGIRNKYKSYCHK